MFKAGRTGIHDEQQEGRPLYSVNNKTVNILHSLLEADSRLTFNNLFHKLLIEYVYITYSHSSIHITL